MKTLAEMLLAPHRHDAVVDDAVRLIETHVGSRSGLRGISLKTGLAMLKTAKPGILNRAVRRLLPEFLDALEPFHAEFRRGTQRDFSRFLQERDARVTAALLTVADTRVRQASPAVRSNYARLRGTAEAEVGAVVPALGRLIDAYLE
ncbi:hypothetical protein AAG565_13275 [Fontimonas sp. SYSU GA230001]|uniref:DUF6918 family protein n=1 Tax=Fontimonas sp. SYSU GA230001 TaxID=3142450 RepID=UPI0032B4680B